MEMIKCNGKEIRRVFLVGNGCFDNGSKPLERAFEFSEDKKSNYFLPDSTKLEPMHALSCLAAEERQWFIQLMHAFKGEWTLPKLPNGEDPYVAIAQHLAGASSFRIIMGKAYNDYCDIKWKRKCHDFLKKKGLYEDDSAIITTNWDNTLAGDDKIKNLVYLHGRCTKPNLMILPTETIAEFVMLNSIFSDNEKHISLLLEKGCSVESFVLIKERFDSSRSKFGELFECENLAGKWLRQANILYSCGLAFNIYDHELTNTIAISSQKKYGMKFALLVAVEIKRENAELSRLFFD